MEGILISDMITEDQRLQELMEIPVPFVAMHSECLAPEQRIGMDRYDNIPFKERAQKDPCGSRI